MARAGGRGEQPSGTGERTEKSAGAQCHRDHPGARLSLFPFCGRHESARLDACSGGLHTRSTWIAADHDRSSDRTRSRPRATSGVGTAASVGHRARRRRCRQDRSCTCRGRSCRGGVAHRCLGRASGPGRLDSDCQHHCAGVAVTARGHGRRVRPDPSGEPIGSTARAGQRRAPGRSASASGPATARQRSWVAAPVNEPSASQTRRRVAVPSGSIVMPAWRRHARSSARSRSRGAVRGADAGGWQPVYFGRAQRWHSDRHLPAARRHGLGDQAGGGTYAAARLGGLAGRTGSKSEDTGRRNARCGGASARDVERGVQLESRATGATRTGRVPPPGCLRWRLLVAGRVHCL